MEHVLLNVALKMERPTIQTFIYLYPSLNDKIWPIKFYLAFGSTLSFGIIYELEYELLYKHEKLDSIYGAVQVYRNGYMLRHPLEYIIKKGYNEIFRFYWDRNVKLYYNLSLASQYGNLEVISFLIKHVIDKNVKYDVELRLAAQYGHLEVVKFFYDKGANIHINNELPLRLAILNNHFSVVEFLLKNGGNIDIPLTTDYRLIDKSMLAYLIDMKEKLDN